MKANAVSGFRATGLCPYNPLAFKNSKILGDDDTQEIEDQNNELISEVMNVNTSTVTSNTERDIKFFRAGFLAGLKNAQERFEAIIPQDLITFYESMKQEGAKQGYFDYNLFAWKELQTRPEPSNNILASCVPAQSVTSTAASDVINPSPEDNQDDPSPMNLENPTESNSQLSHHSLSNVSSLPLVPLPPFLEGTDPTPPQRSSSLDLPSTSSLSSPVTPLGVKDRLSDTARRKILVIPSQHFKASPFKNYLEVSELLKTVSKGKITRESVPRALTSEDNIKFQMEKRLKKGLVEEGREGGKTFSEKTWNKEQDATKTKKKNKNSLIQFKRDRR